MLLRMAESHPQTFAFAGSPAVLIIGSLFFFLLAIHPFGTYPASLALWRRTMQRRPEPSLNPVEPSFAICVPAYNEETGIVAKAENLLALQRTVRNCRLLVYVDAATDRTVELLELYRDRIEVLVGDVRRGKSHGLNMLVEQAREDVLVFTDANVTLHDDALRRIGDRFRDPRVGCVCGHLQYRNGGDSATAATGDLYWRIEEQIRQLESDTVGIVGADGSLFATRRILHPHVPPDIIDDFYVSMKILLGGHAVVRAPDALACERTGTDTRQEFGRKIRIACQAFNVHRLLWGEIRCARAGVIYAYVSHRLLKWLLIYNLLAAAVLAFAQVCTAIPPHLAGAALLAACAAFALADRLRMRGVRRVSSSLAAFTGVGLGVLMSLRGERFQTWTPMTTARARSSSPQ